MTDSIQIPLYRRFKNNHSQPGVKVAETTVDTEDAEELQKHIWRFRETKQPSNKFYAYRYITLSPGKSHPLYMHRAILGLNSPGPKGSNEVDHINGNGLDNRKANLRLLERRHNQHRDSYKGSTSKYRGVSWYKASGKWAACASLNQHRYYLGMYTDEKEAARVAAEWRAANMPYAFPQVID